MIDEEILQELKKINDKLTPKRTFRILSENLIAGISHSVGYFLGTIIVFWILFLFVQQFNVPELIGRQFETVMSQIRWEKVLPTPTQ